MRSVPVKLPESSFMSVFEKTVTPSQQEASAEALAARFKGRLQKQILDAFQAIKDQAQLDKIAQLIQSGAADYFILDALSIGALSVHLDPVLLTLTSLFSQAGQQAAREAQEGIAGGPKIVARFDITDPNAIDYLRNQSSDLITRITSDVKENVRQILGNALADPKLTPMSAARDIRDSIGLTLRQQMALNNYRRYLEIGDARALDRSIGGNAERVVVAGLRNGDLNPEKIQRLVNSYRGRLLTQRAGVIASTETFRALNQGHHSAWKQMARNAEDAADLRRYWVATNDGHTREAHLAIPDMNERGVGLDEPFKSPLGLIMYPGDPDAPPENSINCRCRIVIRYASTPAGLLPSMVAGRSYLPGAVGFTDQSRRSVPARAKA